MNLFVRLIWLWLRSSLPFGRRTPVSVLGPCDTPFIVNPADLDVLMHMNNGRYLSIMDLGRVDLMVRSGALSAIRARGWYPVAAAQTIVYGRSLTLLERFVVRTRVIGWDERNMYLSQDFLAAGQEDGRAAARAVVQARFLGPRGARVSTAELIEAIGYEGPEPAVPEWVTSWAEAQRLLRTETV